MSLISLLSLFSCAKAYSDLDCASFALKAEDPSIVLIDVRTAEEYAEGHIPGAANFDWYASGFLDGIEAAFPKEVPLAVYCRTGKRSANASEVLSKAGYTVFNLLGGITAWKEDGRPVTSYESEAFLTDSCAPVKITLIKHGTLALSYKGIWIQVDPVGEYGKHTDYATEFPKADVILVTHEHGDHLDKSAIDALLKSDSGTALYTNARCVEALGFGTALANGESAQLPDGISLDAVPAYNYTEGRTQFHPKGRDNGFILTIDGLRIYIAGDTEDIPEMALVKDIDVAFLPVNQPYTMTVEQCVNAVKMFAPKVLIPYHFGKTDISPLPGLLPGTTVLLRNMQ